MKRSERKNWRNEWNEKNDKTSETKNTDKTRNLGESQGWEIFHGRLRLTNFNFALAWNRWKLTIKPLVVNLIDIVNTTFYEAVAIGKFYNACDVQ